MKYVDTKIVFSEIPDEITLAINISGCKIHCPDCHSKYLWENVGEILNRISLHKLIESNSGISCVCFMGGDAEIETLELLLYWVKQRFPNLKTAWYSGKDKIKDYSLLQYLDYIKTGPYIKERGPLNNPNTNQSLYKVINTPVPSTLLVDITYKFWKKVNENSSN